MVDVQLPAWLDQDSMETILTRELATIPDTIDKSQGSYLWDALAPGAIELAQVRIELNEALARAFARTTFGTYLDERCAEHGVTRRAAVKSTGEVTFTGTEGASIPKGTRVAVPGDPALETNAIEFLTTEAAVIAEGNTTVTVPVEAADAGANGNVQSERITYLADALPNISAVSNAEATTGGADIESDASLLTRYLLTVQNQSAGGNQMDYRRWSLEVAGVGDVVVIPVAYGNGTVKIAAVGADGLPAVSSLCDTLLAHIADPWTIPGTADDLTASEAGGVRSYTWADFHTLMPRPGIYQVSVIVHRTGTSAATDWLTLKAWNTTDDRVMKVSPLEGAADATVSFDVADISDSAGAPTTLTLNFYWNGSDDVDLILEETIDGSVTLTVDDADVRSLFSQDTGEGLAPIGAAVYVEPADSLEIIIAATLTIDTSYDTPTVQAAVKAALIAYVQGLAFGTARTLYYVKVGAAIVDVPGVISYSGLTINGGTGNISLDVDTVPLIDEDAITLS